ncbi:MULTISPECIES: hypothetical protein [Vagococcus]|uniref:Uncharacterized protein n=1 Tax=Vagococcus fluvialis bH819 TaxID=1255619 RepID=A0A1X6WJU1_9ENTE|nr:MULTISPECIES: hypothetical protein [Vagococcus]SLM84561.1 hypothetical protein FM121_00615 [Vagococcus fluvialis bH819]HCM89974.1 hypothetical protein [Vagococcus sp.]
MKIKYPIFLALVSCFILFSFKTITKGMTPYFVQEVHIEFDEFMMKTEETQEMEKKDKKEVVEKLDQETESKTTEKDTKLDEHELEASKLEDKKERTDDSDAVE